MKSRQIFVFAVTMMAIQALEPAALPAQASQQVLANRILGENIGDRHEALREVRALGTRNVGSAVRAALFEVLHRAGRVAAERYEIDERGGVLDRHPDPEFAARVTEVVVELRDPESIPALAASLATGSTAGRWALAEFGERAAPTVLEVARSADSWPGQVDWALLVLRVMVEKRAERPLSDETLKAIRKVARQHLHATHTGAGLTLRKAIDLAVVLGDPGLRRVVERIASDPAELRSRGLTDPGLIEWVQRLAADRLAGHPPLPRPRP